MSMRHYHSSTNVNRVFNYVPDYRVHAILVEYMTYQSLFGV